MANIFKLKEFWYHDFRDCRLILEQSGSLKYFFITARYQRIFIRGLMVFSAITLLAVSLNIAYYIYLRIHNHDLLMFNQSANQKKQMALEALAAASDMHPLLLANMSDHDLKAYAERMRLRDQSVKQLVDLASDELLQANKTLEMALKVSGLNAKKIEQLKKEAGKTKLASGGAPNPLFLDPVNEQALLELIQSGQQLKSVLEMLPGQHPIAGSRISSSYGLRQHPITGRLDMHPGIDFAPGEDTNIVSPLDGIVQFAGPKGGYGNTVIIDHPGGIQTLFAHMDKLHVKTGDAVIQQQIIGKAGNTGLSTGMHLHYEVRVEGERINPLVPIAMLNDLRPTQPIKAKVKEK